MQKQLQQCTNKDKKKEEYKQANVDVDNLQMLYEEDKMFNVFVKPQNLRKISAPFIKILRHDFEESRIEERAFFK